MGFFDRFRSSGPTPYEVLERELLVPTPDTGEEARVDVLKEDREVSFLIVLDEDGLPVLPAFTSEKALTRWKTQGSAYLALQGKVLVEMLAGSDWDRIVIDGADEDAFAITRSAAQMLVGAVLLPLPAGSTFRIGQPAREPPKGLVDALSNACQHEPAVAEAYLYQFQIVEREEPPQLTVGLLLKPPVAEADFMRVVESIKGEVDPQAWGYESLDYHPLDGELLDTVRSSEPVILHHAPHDDGDPATSR